MYVRNWNFNQLFNIQYLILLLTIYFILVNCSFRLCLLKKDSKSPNDNEKKKFFPKNIAFDRTTEGDFGNENTRNGISFLNIFVIFVIVILIEYVKSLLTFQKYVII